MPSSTVTLTSSFFISGKSALRRYPRSSSLISTSGDQSATARLWISPLPILFGNPAKKNGLKRFCASSISLSGFHVINLFIFLPFWIELNPSRCIALTVYCQSRPGFCVRLGVDPISRTVGDFADRVGILESAVRCVEDGYGYLVRSEG